MTLAPSMSPHARNPALGFVALLLLAVLVYASGLFGGFLFDDFPVLVNNPALQALGTPTQNWLAIALSSDSGVLRRPISLLSFGLNVAAFGMSPLAFKLVNLGIHLLNGGVLYAIARRLAPRLLPAAAAHAASVAPAVALLAAGLWLLHPLQVSSVLYVVQRMNLLATLFTLAGLLCYVDARERALRGEAALLGGFAGLGLFGVLAVFSKENGALIVLYAFVVEAIGYRFAAPQPSQRRALGGFFLATVALPLLALLLFFTTHPHWLHDAYTARAFTLGERLLTQARVVCDYLLWIGLPNPAWMGMFHDDIALSIGLLNPPSTAAAIVVLAALAAAAWRWRRSHPGIAFGIAWFLVGHAMESTILPLEMVFEHRNYLPMAGLLLGLIATLAPALRAHVPARAASGIGLAVLSVCASLTAVRAADWGDSQRLALADARHHPASSRSQFEAGRAVLIAGARQTPRAQLDAQALPYFEAAARLDPDDIDGAIAALLIHARREPVPTAQLADLGARLGRITNYTRANAFLDMLITASNEKLNLTTHDLAGLVDTAMANPHLPPKVRAMILNNDGAYQFNIAHDAQAAIGLTMTAAATDPSNPYFQINLTKIALAVNDHPTAREHLAIAKSLNKTGAYTSEIARLESQL